MTTVIDASGLVTPAPCPPAEFKSADKAVEHLTRLYDEATSFLRRNLHKTVADGNTQNRYRAWYPEIRMATKSFGKVDSRLSFGHVPGPGEYSTTVTRPALFKHYLRQQIRLLVENHGVPVTIAPSSVPIPVHFAVLDDTVTTNWGDGLNSTLRNTFDVPDLSSMHDKVVNGTGYVNPDGSLPLALFTAQRVDYSIARLQHYTNTDAKHFQSLVLFTNYQYYVDEFEKFGRQAIADPESGYSEFIMPGNHAITHPKQPVPSSSKIPQMPAYHLKRRRGNGITLVNIGIGPSNAKTATDHIAVLRPDVWLMLGHCAGLRNGQNLGDFVLAHAYLREDRVLDDDLPVWVPIPALAEVQLALERSVAEISSYDGYNLKRIMRTGTVASVDNRNWELRARSGPVQKLSQSRAIALDMESATIAANGFRFRVPYGTLLCVSDRPLQGELKLPGMASQFYKSQVKQHLKIGIRALEILREMPQEHLHSRKLRSFDETAFL